jgi:hypothetical protein
LSSDTQTGIASPVSCLRETALTLAAVALVVLFCALLLVWDPGFFWIDDYQSGALAGYCDMARAWRSGEVPLLTSSTWHAGALGAEFPAGVFSPSLAVIIVFAFSLGLSLPLTAAVISILHLAILAAGVFRLARQRGLAADLALFATLVATLNGWIILWGARTWGVCLFSFAWVPWLWWGLEYGRQTRHGLLRFVPAGLFLFLLITAGWPLTIVMAALLSAWVMLQAHRDGCRLLALWPTPAAWAVGIGLAAPAWMMLLEALPNAARVQGAGLWSVAWAVPLEALQGLILPNVMTPWSVFGGLKPHVSAELAGGLVPVAILAACLWHYARGCFRALRWEWALCLLLLVVITSPSYGNFRYSFRWLPLFFLALGLLAAQALAWLRRRPDATIPSAGRIAFYAILVIWARASLSQPDAGGQLLPGGLGALCLAFAWWQLEARYESGTWPRTALPVVLVFGSCWLACVTCAPAGELPTWQISESIRQPGALDPHVRYLSVHTFNDIIDTDDRRITHRTRGIGAGLYVGSTACYAGLEFVNGYSPMLPLGMQQLFRWEPHGSFADPADAERILTTETRPDGLLQGMGVDGLVVADRFDTLWIKLTANGWREGARVQGGRVFRRQGSASPRVRAVTQADMLVDRFAAGDLLTGHGRAPLPSILLVDQASPASIRFSPAQVKLVEESRLASVADVESAPGQGEVLVVFARPWFPGYQATCNGKAFPVEVFDLILPAVRLPAGTNGRLVLEYRPRSLAVGCLIAAVTTLGLLGAVLVVLAQRWLQRRACLNDRVPALADSAKERLPA